MLFDTHLHLIYLDRLVYPWLDDVPALKRDASYEDYATLARRIGIIGALHMEVDVAEVQIEQEIDLVKELMSKPQSLMRGAIAACRPEHEDFAAVLERQRSRPEVKGFRRVLHVMPEDLSQSPAFRDNVKRLSGTGLTFDLCVTPRLMPQAIELVDHCPDVTFILDHCGVPDIRSGAFQSWAAQIDKLSERTNVIGKVSGVVAYGEPDSWSLADIRPYVEHTINAFGWDRVIWGSDSPVCNLGANLETWVAATRALLEGCSADERARLMHRNAMQLWQIPDQDN